MGNAKDNTGKWFSFADGDVLWANEQSGSDLNVDLQKNIADDIDGVIDLVVGNCVINATSFRITPGPENCSVNITSGYVIIDGQRGRMENDVYVQSLSYPATHKFFVELDNENNAYDKEKGAWSTKITRLTTGTPTGSYLYIGEVSMPSDQVVQPEFITDHRLMHEPQGVIANNLNDDIPIHKNARSIRRRLGMFAHRIKDIIGSETPSEGRNFPSWLDPLPGSGTGSLTNIWKKFSSSSGHAHDGSSDNGTKIQAINIISTTSSGISATNVQGALEQLDTKKVSTDGSRAMTGPLTLAGNPTAPFHAATKQYVDQAVRVKQLVKARVPSNQTITSAVSSMLETNLSITTSGGIVKFEAGTGIWARPVKNLAYKWNPTLKFHLHRNGERQQTQTVQVYAADELGGSETAPEPHYIFIPIPIFYDNPGSGTYVYDLKWKFEVVGYAGSTIEGNFNTGVDVENAGFWWYAVEM